MPRQVRQPQRAFTGGETSPNTQARADLANWKTSLAIEENFVSFIQGGVTRRSGTRDVDAAYATSVFVPFAFSATDGYAIDFRGNGTARFYRDNGFLQNGDGTPYELSHPFAAAELDGLRYAQNANAMFLASSARAIQLLERPGSGPTFTLTGSVMKNGPFMPLNIDDTNYVSSTHAGEIAKGVAFDLVASKATFNALHVGALWLIREMDSSNAVKWQAGMQMADGVIATWDGNTYKKIGADAQHCGTDPPVHLVGAEWDGFASDLNRGYLWLYLHSGWGVAQITAYTDSRHVTATALSYIPASLQNASGGDANVGTNKWAEGAFSDLRGYPSLVGFHKKRLYTASTPAQPTSVFASVIDDFTNNDAQSVDDDKAFVEELAADTGRVNIPVWMISGQSLAIGTAGDEFVLASAESGTPITPDTVESNSATTEGSASMVAVKIDGPIFVSKDRRRVHELLYDFSTNSYAAPDLTDLADHIAGPGFIKTAWQREPYRLLWALRSDGMLASMSYRRDEGVRAWHRHPITKGTVLDICTVPAPDGTRQDLWLKVQYDLQAGSVLRIQMLQPFFERGTLNVADAWFCDAGYLAVPAPPAVTFTQFALPTWFVGETVSVLADGKVVPDQIVGAGGLVTIPVAAKKAVVGLPMLAQGRTLRLDVEGAAGQLAGKNAKISSVVPDVLRTGGLDVRGGDGEWEPAMPSSGGTFDASATLWTGPLRTSTLASSWHDDGSVSWRCVTPLPATLRALTPIAQAAR